MDGSRMSWEDEHEKAIAKVQAQLEAGEFSDVIAKHARAMTRIEIIWKAADRALGESPEAGEARSLFHDFKSLHSRADMLANKLANQPMPRSGDR